MSADDWGLLARRGELDAHIYTRERLRQQGVEIEHPFLVVVFPDGLDTFPLACPTVEALISWAQETQPRTLQAFTAGHSFGEDADSLIALVRGRVH